MRHTCDAKIVNKKFAAVHAPFALKAETEVCGKPAVDHHGPYTKERVYVYLCAEHWDEYQRDLCTVNMVE